jgi:hypothetical protein
MRIITICLAAFLGMLVIASLHTKTRNVTTASPALAPTPTPVTTATKPGKAFPVDEKGNPISFTSGVASLEGNSVWARVEVTSLSWVNVMPERVDWKQKEVVDSGLPAFLDSLEPWQSGPAKIITTPGAPVVIVYYPVRRIK